jgi:hypothetical protein
MFVFLSNTIITGDLYFFLKKIIFIVIKLANAKTDEEVQSILTQDDTLDVLDSIGYRGIPQRETTTSVINVIRLFLIIIFSILLFFCIVCILCLCGKYFQ